MKCQFNEEKKIDKAFTKIALLKDSNLSWLEMQHGTSFVNSSF